MGKIHFSMSTLHLPYQQNVVCSALCLLYAGKPNVGSLLGRRDGVAGKPILGREGCTIHPRALAYGHPGMVISPSQATAMASGGLVVDAAQKPGPVVSTDNQESAEVGLPEAPQVQCVEIVNKEFTGVRVAGWQIQTKKRSILNMGGVQSWEKLLETSHLPEMVFGNSSLELLHEATGIKIHFNALDALHAWKEEKLPPVEVPAAAKWKFRSKPSQQLILDYDYTFTTPYSGSEVIEELDQPSAQPSKSPEWVECKDQINLVALQAKDPILFYDEVVLYEDELADNGIAFLSVKVRVMPTCWFLLLRFWLRVDGSIMRLRDTRMFSAFQEDTKKEPLVIREHVEREETFESLARRGLPSESSAYADPNAASEKLQITKRSNEKLVIRVEAQEKLSS